MSKTSDGRLGEKNACIFLKREGYEILERNWHCRWGEIDIIAKQNGTLVFVEVKARSNYSFGNPQDYIDSRKLRKLQIAINMYLSVRELHDSVWRLDGVCITRESKTLHFEHFKGLLEEQALGIP